MCDILYCIKSGQVCSCCSMNINTVMATLSQQRRDTCATLYMSVVIMNAHIVHV